MAASPQSVTINVGARDISSSSEEEIPLSRPARVSEPLIPLGAPPAPETIQQRNARVFAQEARARREELRQEEIARERERNWQATLGTQNLPTPFDTIRRYAPRAPSTTRIATANAPSSVLVPEVQETVTTVTEQVEDQPVVVPGYVAPAPSQANLGIPLRGLPSEGSSSSGRFAAPVERLSLERTPSIIGIPQPLPIPEPEPFPEPLPVEDVVMYQATPVPIAPPLPAGPTLITPLAQPQQLVRETDITNQLVPPQRQVFTQQQQQQPQPQQLLRESDITAQLVPPQQQIFTQQQVPLQRATRLVQPAAQQQPIARPRGASRVQNTVDTVVAPPQLAQQPVLVRETEQVYPVTEIVEEEQEPITWIDNGVVVPPPATERITGPVPERFARLPLGLRRQVMRTLPAAQQPAAAVNLPRPPSRNAPIGPPPSQFSYVPESTVLDFVKPNSNSTMWWTLGISVGVVLVLALAVYLVIWYFDRRTPTPQPSVPDNTHSKPVQSHGNPHTVNTTTATTRPVVQVTSPVLTSSPTPLSTTTTPSPVVIHNQTTAPLSSSISTSTATSNTAGTTNAVVIHNQTSHPLSSGYSLGTSTLINATG